MLTEIIDGNVSHTLLSTFHFVNTYYGEQYIVCISFEMGNARCFDFLNHPLAALVRDTGDTEGGFFFLIGRRRSGKKPNPSGKPCPLGELMVFICRRLPANEKDHFSVISVPQVSETNGW